MTSVISFNGQAFGSGYTAWFRIEDATRTRTVGPSLITPTGRRPSLTSTRHDPVTLPVQIRVKDGGSLDELDKWLRTGTTGDLVIEVATGDQRRVSATVTRTLPYDRGPNVYTVVFTVPDGRWRSAVKECWDAGGLTWSGNEITDTTRATGTEGDGAGDVDRVGIWEATTNLIGNGGFETNTAGWLALNANTIAVSTDVAKFGSQSLKCTVVNTNRMAIAGVAISSSTTYIVSGWVYIPASWTGVVDTAWTFTHTVGTPTVDFAVNADVSSKDSWQYVQARVLSDSSATDLGIEIGFPSGGTSTEFIYLDGFQMEALNHPTPYVETDGGTESRSAGRVQIAAQELDETQGWVAFRVRSGFVEDPSGTQVHDPATLFYWYDDASNYYWFRYEDQTGATGRWRMLRRGSGSGTGSVNQASLTAGDEVTVIARWTATTTGISVAGGAFADSANTAIPTMSAATLDLGSDAGSANHWDGDVYWFAAGTGTLTDDDAAAIAATGNTLPTRWPDAAGRCLTWLADDLVDDQTIISATNDGTIDTDDLVVTLQPLTAKPGTADWIYRRQVVIANRAPNPLSGWAFELTDGGWDHLSAVGSGFSQADGDDVRVFVDGEEVPRWFGSGSAAANQSTTLIWAVMSMSGGLETELLTAIASSSVPAVGSPITFASGALAGWPDEGTLLVGDECIDFTDRDGDTITVAARGARNTTAAAHSAAAAVYWVERQVEVIYGNTGATAPLDASHLQPMIDLTNSTNSTHVWSEFSHDTKPRAMQWSRVQRQRDSQSDKMLAPGGKPSTGAVVQYRTSGPVAGKPAFNGWIRSVPCGTRFGSSNHPMAVNNLVVSDSIIAQFYGIDGDGNEVPLLNEGLGVTDVSASTNADDPDAPLYSLELSARNGVVVGSPGAEYDYDGGLPGIDISSTDGRVTSVASLAQPFTVPDVLDDVGYIDSIGILARSEIATGFGANNTIVLDVSIAQDDGAGGYTAIGTGQVTVNNTSLATNYVWYTATLTDRVRVTAGQRIYVFVEWNSAPAGSPTYAEWYTITASFEDVLLSHATRVMSSTLDNGPNAVAVNLHSMTAQAATIYYGTGAPYVSFGGQQDLYWLDGALTRGSQSIAFEVPVTLLDEVVVDVAARTVRNTTQDSSALNAVTVSSSDWITIEPGANALTYIEDAAVSVRVQAEWSHRWQS